ncbi:MAG: MAPEG family protein [Gammaproteobacteria bacterium]
MTPSAIAICGLVMWSVFLTFTLISIRMNSILGDGKAFNQFHSDARDMAEAGAGVRITRAHANSLDNLALPIALILLAMATGNGAITDGLAMAYLGCRILQSVIHMISISNTMIMVRGTFFTAQLVILIIWAVNLSGAA